MADTGEVTALLAAIREGDRDRMDQLFELVYGELRRLARSRRRRWVGDYTLNTTALIHEAYLKLVAGERADWQNRAHFYGVAATAMRHILVNYAERAHAAKRGGDAERVELDEEQLVSADAIEEVLAVHQALARLECLSERQAKVVECRFFGGLEVAETAEALGVGTATVKRDWKVACAWLLRELSGEGLPGLASRLGARAG